MSIPSEQALWQMGKSADEWADEYDAEVRAEAIDEAFDLLWKMATSKYDEALCLEELSNDIDEAKAQLKVE